MIACSNSKGIAYSQGRRLRREWLTIALIEAEGWVIGEDGLPAGREEMGVMQEWEITGTAYFTEANTPPLSERTFAFEHNIWVTPRYASVHPALIRTQLPVYRALASWLSGPKRDHTKEDAKVLADAYRTYRARVGSEIVQAEYLPIDSFSYPWRNEEPK